MHPACAGLAAVPEGDWHCPWCHCAACNQPGWGGGDGAAPARLLPAGVSWVECGGDQYRSMSELSGSDPAAYRPPYVGGPEAPSTSQGVPAPAAVGAGAQPGDGMDIDGRQHAEQAQQEEAMAVDGAGPQAHRAAEGAGGGEAPGEAAGGSGRLDLSQLHAALAEAAASCPQQSSAGTAGRAAPVADAAAGEARCPATGRRFHARCLPEAQQAQLDSSIPQQPWFSSTQAESVSWQLAQLCSRGVLPVGALGDGTPLSFQLVRGAAVAQPEVRRY